MYSLGDAYWEGRGVARDYKEAVGWFRKGADAGHAAAMNGLGYAYELGQGVPQNYAEAQAWYQKAADAGSTAALWNLAIAYDEETFGTGYNEQAARNLLAAAAGGNQAANDALFGDMNGYWSRATRQALQRILSEDGYYTGSIDGDIGPGTKSAIEDYLFFESDY